jgi:hypothetical protein
VLAARCPQRGQQVSAATWSRMGASTPAAARTTGGGCDELARYRLRGEPQQKIRAEHLGRTAVVYVWQCRRSCNSALAMIT